MKDFEIKITYNADSQELHFDYGDGNNRVTTGINSIDGILYAMKIALNKDLK